MNKLDIQKLVRSVDIGYLIERLGPLNNRWRNERMPKGRVLTLWDMGDVILTSVPNPSDPLLWKIQERSYITRVILRYALIVRRAWKRRSVLEDLVRDLRSYTVFREALPFLKGDREGISESTYQKVVSLLSSPNTSEAIRYLKGLKAQKIGRQHKKGASVAKIRNDALSFKQALVQLEAKVSATSASNILIHRKSLIALSQLTMVIATGEIVEDVPSAVVNAKEHLPELAGPLIAAIQGGKTSVAAFCKVVGARHLMEAADLFNSMRTEETLGEWRRRHSAKLSLGSWINTSK